MKKELTNNISRCRLNLNFDIICANDKFSKETGYSEVELINESFQNLCHCSMPQIIYNVLSSNLKQHLNYNIISLDITKEGNPYWSFNNFTTDKDSNGNITGYTNEKKPLSKRIIQKIKPFYDELNEIELSKGNSATESYFNCYLREEIGCPYEDYLLDLFRDKAPEVGGINLNKLGNSFEKTWNWFFYTEYES